MTRGQRTRSIARGMVAGPFHGVPFTAKDVFETARVETRVGLSERVGIVPSEDAVAVARMRRAGAILLGKTNVPPGGSGGVTDNSVYGRTRNPFDRERSAAGSSGGEAAIQAAGGSPVGLGSDSGGSLRVPAHYCGIATLKPTTGRVPNTGAFAHKGGLSDSRTQIGPLSRFVEDLAPTLSIIAGPDSRDSGVVPVPLGDSGAARLGGLQVAFYTEDGETATTPDTAAAVREAAEALRQSGARVSERCPANVGRDALDITRRYWDWNDLEGGKSVQLLADWDRFRTDMLTFMESVEIILCPTAPTPAPSTAKVSRRCSTTHFRTRSPDSLASSCRPVVRATGCRSASRSSAAYGGKIRQSPPPAASKPRSEDGAGHP